MQRSHLLRLGVSVHQESLAILGNIVREQICRRNLGAPLSSEQRSWVAGGERSLAVAGDRGQPALGSDVGNFFSRSAPTGLDPAPAGHRRPAWQAAHFFRASWKDGSFLQRTGKPWCQARCLHDRSCVPARLRDGASRTTVSGGVRAFCFIHFLRSSGADSRFRHVVDGHCLLAAPG
jgi:hypothetical protein